jgi:hypothetical protein
VWAIDFVFDETSDRRRLKIATIVDEYTREALAIRVDRTCTADGLVAVIEDLVLTRGAPEHLRADNGPEMVAWALRDYCRLAGKRALSGAWLHNGERYQLDRAQVRVDLDDLDHLLTSANSDANSPVALEKARALWRGEPLEGTDYFWADGERRNLHATLVDLLNLDFALTAAPPAGGGAGMSG